MNESKIKTYLGFAMRARKVVLGINAARAIRGNVSLLIADRDASPNAQKEIAALQARFACPLVVVDNLEELTGKAFCKLAALREGNLAHAILMETEEKEISEEGTEYGV